MHFRTTACLLATAVPLVASAPSYTIPSSFFRVLAVGDCTYPEAFDIQNFQTWTPSEGNSASPTVHFRYYDMSTHLRTSCQYNSTSKNVGLPDLAPRYACDKPIVEFIWQNETLTMIETACPGGTGSTRWEASGAVIPELTCQTSGGGSLCSATHPNIGIDFTSLQPTPKEPNN